jgi:hypothetical protein
MDTAIRAARLDVIRTRLQQNPFATQSALGPEFFRPETKPQIRPIPPARDRISKTVRHKSPLNAGFFPKVSVAGDLGDCVVADTVAIEPVSASKFPAIREMIREFLRFQKLQGYFSLKRTNNHSHLRAYSLCAKTGNFFGRIREAFSGNRRVLDVRGSFPRVHETRRERNEEALMRPTHNRSSPFRNDRGWCR